MRLRHSRWIYPRKSNTASGSMAALISKPGLTSASTLSIPADWSATWFRSLIQNQLKGADVRNATGINGISVTGNIASPYATIGFAAPVMIPGPVTITDTTDPFALTLNGTGTDVQLLLNTPSGRFSGLYMQKAGVTEAELFFDATANQLFLSYDVAASAFHLRGPGGVVAFTASATGALTGLGTVAGAQVTMTPDRGSFTLTHTGFTTAVTSAANFYRIGNVVILNTGNISGTSNATTWTATGIPASIQPTGGLIQTITIGDAIDSGVGIAATVSLSSGSGTLTFGKGFASGGAFTNTGTKGFSNTGGTTFCYLVA